MIGFTLVSLLAAGLIAAKLTNRPIAVVNGETILLSDFQKNWETLLDQQKERMPADRMDAAWKAKARQDLLDQMIDDKVLLSEAKKRKLKVPQRDFETGVFQVKARFLPESAQRELQAILKRQTAAQGANAENAVDFGAGWKELEKANPSAIKEAEATFKKELAKEGMDEKKFQDRIRDQLSVIQLSREEVRSRVRPPTDEQVKALFAKVTDRMNGKNVDDAANDDIKDLDSLAKFFTQRTAERVRARHILIGVASESGEPGDWEKATPEQKAQARKTLTEIRKKIMSGADFAELAEKNSIDKGSAARGGDLGFFTRGQMVPPFEKVAFTLPVGQISDIVETRFGLHLIQVEEKKAATKLRFEEVEDDLRDYLFQAAQQKAFESFSTGLRKSSDVKVLVKPEELADL